MITGSQRLPVNDGYLDHPKARVDCPICNGGGLLDDGDSWGSVIVPCPCTGDSDPEVTWKVWKNYLAYRGYIAKVALCNITRGYLMARDAMSSMFQHLLEQAKKDGKLRDLLVTPIGHKHPQVSIGNVHYKVGLVDDKVMLVDGNGMLHDPEIAYNTLTAINWTL